ncbi:uncharacterized protein LOC117304836 isoform X1 [Asterias rubens]|uniref:uncharacterized protein LOC117304836 isoform X1 n=1 Tax=Asterias rubens TaxID=7604 RepID=UPI001455A999|nr:uncharacterized protein LOC117304836 isoform X1 [Asterias rubens]
MVTVGWKHYDPIKDQFKQVYSSKGGGTFQIHLDKSMTYAEVLGRLKNLFFPGGKNGDLEVAHLTLSLGNYVGDVIKHELTLEDGSTTTFTIESYLGYCKTQKIRLYLITKVDPLRDMFGEVSDISDEDDALPDPGLVSIRFVMIGTFK